MSRHFNRSKIALSVLTILATVILPFTSNVVEAVSSSTLFSDGFESGNLTSWSSVTGNWANSIGNPHAGTRRAGLDDDTGSSADEIRKDVSTDGFGTITFNYWYLADSLESGNNDTVLAQWSSNSGTTWNTVFTINDGLDDNVWHSKAHSLPGDAENTSGFRFRFLASFQGSNDRIRIDDVSVTGNAISTPTTGTLVVKKRVINDNGGTTATSSFSFQIDGGTPVAFNANGTNSVTIAAGTHSVTEISTTGYATTYSNCTGVTVAVSGTTTCTITNDDIQPKLTITKVVVNDNDGTKVVSDFPLFVNSTSVTSGVQNGFNAGSYAVSETNDSTYAAAISGDCATNGTITLVPGDVKSCTITNNDVLQEGPTGTLIIKKTLINDNGGTAATSSFSFRVDGGSATSFESDGSNSVTVSVGNHSVVEVSASGYVATYDNCADVHVSAGQPQTCTITNNDIATESTPTPTPTPASGSGARFGTLVVEKVVRGGTMTFGDFWFSFGESDHFDVDGRNEYVRPAGTYTVLENTYTGYTTTYGGDCSAQGVVALAQGQIATCVVTNTAASWQEGDPVVTPSPTTSPAPSTSPTSASSTPTPTPTPSVEVTPTPTPSPTETPVAEATPTPNPTPTPFPAAPNSAAAGGAQGGAGNNPNAAVNASNEEPTPEPSATPDATGEQEVNNQAAAIGSFLGLDVCTTAGRTSWWVLMIGLSVLLLWFGRTRGAYPVLTVAFAAVFALWAAQVCSFGFAWLPIVTGGGSWLVSIPRPGAPKA